MSEEAQKFDMAGRLGEIGKKLAAARKELTDRKGEWLVYKRKDKRQGKEVESKYAPVALRVDALRNHFGAELALLTKVLDTGDPNLIRVECCVLDIQSMAMLAKGHAQERSGGYIAQFLENCETSAIGRALANLGLNGGEFASADEIKAEIEKEREAPERLRASPEQISKVKDLLAKQPKERVDRIYERFGITDLIELFADDAERIITRLEGEPAAELIPPEKPSELVVEVMKLATQKKVAADYLETECRRVSKGKIKTVNGLKPAELQKLKAALMALEG